MKGLAFGLAILVVLRLSAEDVDVTILRKQAQSGDAAAALQLAHAYEFGKGVQADQFEAADWYMKAAQAGSAEAQNFIGIRYRTGEGLPKDLVKALEWYRKSAKQGNADAMFNLGTVYYNGDGIAIDDAEAFAWFAVASDFGSKAAPDAVRRGTTDLKSTMLVDGLTSAAIKLCLGVEIPRKPEAAVVWLKKAIELKNIGAQVMLAKLYIDGDGVLKDEHKAWSLCEDAANRKFPLGMRCLGYMARNGFGLPSRNPELAAAWYGKAADCGDAESIYNLGEIYKKGDGVRADALMAYVYYGIAARFEPKALEAAKKLEPSLGAKDIRKASEKAQSLMEKMRYSNCQWDR